MKTLRSIRKDRERKAKIIQTATSLKEAQVRIDELEAQVKAVKALKGAKTSFTISPRQGTDTSEAVAIAVATDWHLGSTVRPEQVSGLNTFSVAIAEHRIKNFFERIVKLTNKERHDIKIDELVLFLGGDL